MKLNNAKLNFAAFCILALGFLNACNHTNSEPNMHHARFASSQIPDRIMLSWNQDPMSSRSITWRTNTSVKKAYVEYCIADASPDFKENVVKLEAITKINEVEGYSANYHSVVLDGLQLNTAYVYRVGTDNAWSEWLQFRMPQNANNDFSFVFLGDAQNDMKDYCSRVFRQAQLQDPNADFFLHAGDLVDQANNNDEWGEWFYAGSWIYSMFPQLVVAGNHEHFASSDTTHQNVLTKLWNASFTLPANGPEKLKETCYFFDYKNTRFIVLNTQAMMKDNESGPLQVAWLDSVLKNNHQQWTIVAQHHPIFSARGDRGDYPIRSLLEPYYVKYAVDLVLQGHHHSFARGRHPDKQNDSILTEPVYVVSVSGPKMYDTNFDPWMERVGTNSQFYHTVQINDNKIVFNTFLTDGTLYDQFKIRRDSDGRKIFNEFIPKNTPERVKFPSYSYGADVAVSEEILESYSKKAESYIKEISIKKMHMH